MSKLSYHERFGYCMHTLGQLASRCVFKLGQQLQQHPLSQTLLAGLFVSHKYYINYGQSEEMSTSTRLSAVFSNKAIESEENVIELPMI